MAIKVFDCKGYGQIEPSQVWFTRSGMSESQCAFDKDVIMSTKEFNENNYGDKVVGENGVFYMIDKDAKKVTIPTKTLSDLGYQMGINYSTERIYDERTPGRRFFKMFSDEYLPRLGFVEPGMRICTNAIAWDDTHPALANIESDGSESVNMYNAIKTYLAEKKETPGKDPLYLVVTPESKGRLCLVKKADVANALGNVYAQITEAYTNADRTLSFKIMFINKPVID